MEEMMSHFKSEPDLPKEPKVKDDPDQEPGHPTPKPKAKSKPKPKPKTQGKPRAVAAPSVPFRSKTSRCLMISALVGLLGGKGGAGAELQGTVEHDICLLPHWPAGGGASLLPSRPCSRPLLLAWPARPPRLHRLRHHLRLRLLHRRVEPDRRRESGQHVEGWTG